MYCLEILKNEKWILISDNFATQAKAMFYAGLCYPNNIWNKNIRWRKLDKESNETNLC